MPIPLQEIFEDKKLVDKIKRRLPHLFHYAERDSSRAGKVGMEVGSLRERILVAMLIYKFGEENVETELPITEHDVDVKVKGQGISIKSVTTKSSLIGPVKAIWTVDAKQARDFGKKYRPTSDYLIAHLIWGSEGGLYHVPLQVQNEVFAAFGRGEYLKLPKRGTNPRGVEITRQAMRALVSHEDTNRIIIDWQRPEGEYDAYERWIEYWRLD